MHPASLLSGVLAAAFGPGGPDNPFLLQFSVLPNHTESEIPDAAFFYNFFPVIWCHNRA